MVTDSDFHSLIATLQRALDLRLTKSQRTKLKAYVRRLPASKRRAEYSTPAAQRRGGR